MNNKNTTEEQFAIRDVINAYSHYADRRQPDKQASLFTKDAIVEVYTGEPDKNNPVQVIKGTDELIQGFSTLKQYEFTTHFNGQSTLTVDGDKATGETYCLAHHLWTEAGQRMLMVMSIRYYDDFVKQDGKWLFAKRQLIIDWADKRPSSAQ